MKSFLLFALLFTFSLLSYPKEFYVDQSTSSPSNEQDGSKSSPFSSLEAAFKAITFGTFDIVLLGQSYTVSQQESFTTEDAVNEIIITIRAEEGFTLKYTEQGQIWCTNYQQNIITPPIKNVNISFIGLNIETQSTIPIFYGDCYFTFKNILIDELRSTLYTAKSEGSALLQNFTINNIVLGVNQSLIDQNSLERIQGDYLILDSVTMKNTATNSALIKSYLQYKKIEVKDSDLEGISFGIIGEEIGGNNKTNITVQNVTMRNAQNFFMIDSYGILVVENSTFTNTSNRAFFFFLADENLSPILATFKNCVFENNIVQFAGGAITFQGSSETSYQFSLNTIITGCKFTNNQASFSGGALALLYLENANVTISNSEFTSNLGTESGGAIYTNGGESTFSMTIKNTTFISNSAFSGGVFSFEFMNYSTIILDSNLYANNSAKFEGGIGVVSESVITLTDTNSIATGNYAGFQGGAWSFDSDSTDSDSSVMFQEVLFDNNRAFLKGGCISNNGVSLWLNRVSFENCSLAALSSLGGAVYIGEDATVTVTDSQFINNQAELGAAIAIQSLSEKPMILDGITLQSNLSKLGNDAPTVKSQIISGPGELVLKNLTVPNLHAPFLSQQSGKIGMKNVRLGTIKCNAPDDSLNFCIFGIQADGEDAQSIVIEDLYVESADSSIPLLISQGSTVLLNSVMVNETKLPANVPMWEIRNSAVKASKVELMDFNNKWILVADSELELEDSNFGCKREGLGVEDDNEDTNDTYDFGGKCVLVPNTTNNMNNTQQ